MNEASNATPAKGPTATVNRFATAIKGVSVALIVLSVALIFRQLPVGPAVQALEGWIESLGIWGPLTFGLIYVVAVAALIPGSALTLAAGALFGLVSGTIVTSLASTTGAALAFLISRYLARDRIAAEIRRYPKFDAIDKAISASGWKIVALLRLSPAVPFNLQNYLYGLTGIRFWPCVLASWVAMLPGTFLYVYLGHIGRESLEAAAGGAERPRSLAEWAMLIVGLLATLAVAVYLTYLARKALHQYTGIALAEESRPDALAGQSRPKGWPWGATVAAVLALAVLAVAGYVQFHPDLFQRLFAKLLGSH
jgi:uncharacterized membrane protein YdjX (TVP38/TMEM64 family)